MTVTPILPPDHRKITDHRTKAIEMRRTGQWVLVSTPPTRRAAYEAARRIREGLHPAYMGACFWAQVRTTETGTHQVWGRFQPQGSTP